jgi:hypothetical protein
MNEEFNLQEEIEKLMKYIIQLNPSSREFTTANYFIREDIQNLYNKGCEDGYEKALGYKFSLSCVFPQGLDGRWNYALYKGDDRIKCQQ